MMRVIAGRISARPIRSPKGAGFRPTGERVREALFSILGDRIAAGPFLDLYAGSASVGIEAWSRGAPRVVFVEHDREVVRVIERNLDGLGVDRGVQVITLDAIRALRGLARLSPGFAVAFADPPYDYPRYARLLRAIAENGILAPGGLFVLEHAARTQPGDPPPPLRPVRTARYGDAVLDFYEAIPPSAGPAA